MGKDKEGRLTEWDFDIPPDNRFHDPFESQNRDAVRGDKPETPQKSAAKAAKQNCG